MNLSKMWNKDYVKKWLRSKINVSGYNGNDTTESGDINGE